MLEENLAALAADEEAKEIQEEKEPIKTEEEELGEEKSPYQEEAERIAALEEKHKLELEEAELERQRQMAIKDKALENEKQKTKGVKEAWRDETLKEVDRKLDLRDAKIMVKGMVDDPTAEQVILHHYERLPEALKTGDIKADLITAQALALRNRLPSLLAQDSMNDQANAKSIASMGAPSRSSSFSLPPSQAARATSKLLNIVAGNDRDRAKKLAERAAKTLK